MCICLEGMLVLTFLDRIMMGFPVVAILILVPLALAEPNWKRLGCFHNNHRSTYRKYWFSEPMTVWLCGDFCQAMTSKWFGLEEGSKCFCGTSDPPSKEFIAPHSDCKIPCRGAENCGGQNVSALYQGETYKGCYTNRPVISLAFKYNVSDLTLDVCLGRCSGFSFIALTQGNKCLCTNQQPPEQDRQEDSSCVKYGIKCVGGETCGGVGKTSVWKTEAKLDTVEDIEREVKEVTHVLQKNTTNEEEVVEAAEVIEESSKNSVKLIKDDPELLEVIADSMEALSNQRRSSVNVTRPLVNAVNNIMNLDEDTVQQSSKDTAKVLDALEQQISNVQSNKGNYTQITDNVGIKAVKVDRKIIKKSINFGTFLQSSGTPSKDGNLDENNTRMFEGEDDLEDAETIISVPVTVLDLFSHDSNETVVPVSFVIYDNPTLFVPSKPLRSVNETSNTSSSVSSREMIATQVISVNVQITESSENLQLPKQSRITAGFLLTKKVLKEGEILKAKRCVRWNRRSRLWSKKGCDPIIDTSDRMKCSCDRLGSFAILIRIGKDDVIPSQETLYWITFIGSILSCVCLCLCMVTLLGLKSLRVKTAVYIHLNLCISLLCFYISFILSMEVTADPIACSIFSSIVHYFALVLVAWMTIEAIHLYIMFVKRHKLKLHRFLLAACSLGYGVPILPTVLVALFDKFPSDQEMQYCFLHPGPGLYYGFILEVGILCIFNIFVYIWITNRVVCRPLMASQVQQNAKREEILARVRHGVLFWFVLGISWTFGFLAAIDRFTPLFDYLFCISLSLQGVVLFLLLALTNPELKKAYRSFTWKSAKSETRSTNTSEGTSVFDKAPKRKKMRPTELLLLKSPQNKLSNPKRGNNMYLTDDKEELNGSKSNDKS